MLLRSVEEANSDSKVINYAWGEHGIWLSPAVSIWRLNNYAVGLRFNKVSDDICIPFRLYSDWSWFQLFKISCGEVISSSKGWLFIYV